jgi:hypothetical protein
MIDATTAPISNDAFVRRLNLIGGSAPSAVRLFRQI